MTPGPKPKRKQLSLQVQTQHRTILSHSLLERFNEQTQKPVQKVGDELYGTLSMNIHHHKGEFAISDNQWDVPQAAILHALTPGSTRRADGSIEWGLER